MERRTFLAAACTGVTPTIAGCSGVVFGGDSDPPPHGHAPDDAVLEQESSEEYLNHTFSATVELEAGWYTAQAVSRTSVMDVNCQWETNGNPIDVYCLRPEAYEETWQERGSDLRSIDQLTRTGQRSGRVSGLLDAGTYYLVFDNTGAYGSSPGGAAVVEYFVTASIGSASR